MDDIEWTVVNEGYLLESMVGHKPVGVNKYFQMAFICDKFAENYQKEVSSEKVWAHLATMYNLKSLDENEAIPFPNTEKEFALPDADFGTLLSKKEEEKKVQKGRETPKKEVKKEEKTPKQSKEVARRDSKDSKDKTPAGNKKEVKKEPEKTKSKGKGNNTPKEKEDKRGKNNDDTPKPAKRPTRGSLKDDSSSSGKSSPVTVTPPVKRRRI